MVKKLAAFLPLVLALLLAVSSSGCLLSATADVQIYNNSAAHSVWFVYYKPSGALVWSGDLLGLDIIPPFGTYVLSGFEPGTYDLWAEWEDGTDAFAPFVDLAGGQTYQWTVTY